MNPRDELKRKVEFKRQDLATLEGTLTALQTQIAVTKAEIAAYGEALALIPEASERQKHKKAADQPLKPGSDMDKVVRFLRALRRPAHLHEIIEGIGREVSDKTINSIGSQLSVYVRRGRYFIKPRPHTFGLLEFTSKELSHREGAAVVDDGATVA